MRVANTLTIVLACATYGCAKRSVSTEQFHLLDLSGKIVNPFQVTNAPTLVLFFISTDCPISNSYAPEIKRLHERFAGRGFEFCLIYPDAATSGEAIKRHMAEYGYDFGVLRDPDHIAVKSLGITVTPEVAVIARDGQVLYRGRIDDRFPALGTSRPPAQHDLENALTAISQGKAVTISHTRAVGCYIGGKR